MSRTLNLRWGENDLRKLAIALHNFQIVEEDFKLVLVDVVALEW